MNHTVARNVVIWKQKSLSTSPREHHGMGAHGGVRPVSVVKGSGHQVNKDLMLEHET